MHEGDPGSGDHEDEDDELLGPDSAFLEGFEGVFEPDSVMPPEDELAILDFLNRFNVKHTPETSHETLSIIWASLNRNPSLVKDFVYVISDVNMTYNYSELTLPVSVEDIVEWCDELKGRETTIRMVLIRDTVVPNLVDLGYDEEEIEHKAWGEYYGFPPQTAEAVRFLGWLVGQNFMKGVIGNELYAHLDRRAIAKPRLSHLAYVAESLVRKRLKRLNEMTKRYEVQNSMIERARPAHEDRIYALDGINKNCLDLFHPRKPS